LIGFNAPFLPENQVTALYDFSFYKIQQQTKTILVEMLKNFFCSANTIYKLQFPDIVEIQNSKDLTKLFISRDFPYEERKVPIIVVSLKSAKENKMYIGADNFLTYIERKTSTGKVAIPLYHGAVDLSMSLIIVARSSDERMHLAELLGMCFTHYYRWQYFYTTDDGYMLSIVPSTTPVDYGSESETTDVSSDSLLYITDLIINPFVEYTFTDLEHLHYLEDYNVDPESGPIEVFNDP